jgi:superfamily II RNA helicase
MGLLRLRKKFRMKQKHRPPGLTELLRRVGEAPAVAFAPAPFQIAALDALERGDVLVSAPTGSGKTWIAEQEIARLLRLDTRDGGAGPVPGRVWYTAPLKALSNQKFRRFQRLYGEATVGLLTGERRVNSHAPVLVATTEILRNVLYDTDRFSLDAGGRVDGRGDLGGTIPLEVVVLDEAHYLADRERGTAWEEILLLAPPETRLLLLSATVPNAGELAAWLEMVRGRRPEVVTLETRPVPLQYLLADGAGRLLPPDPHAVMTRSRNLRWLRAAADAIEERKLTPAILFFPSRRECDEAAKLLGHRSAPDEARRAERLEEWIAQVPHLAQHPLLTPLRRAGVAPHHAGHLTAWRMCVEELLEAGLVRFVCATTTLAAGLDVPARTVLLSTLHRHGPAGPEALTPTEFHQMTGRAGRRGRDLLGIAIVAVENPSEADEALALADADPDPVVSAFTPSDAQVLNLLARASMLTAEGLLRRSFAAFQRRAEITSLRKRLESLPGDPLTTRPCGDRVATRDRFERLLQDLRHARRAPEGRRTDASDSHFKGSPEAAGGDSAMAGQTQSSRVGDLGRAILEMPCTGCPVVEKCLATIKAQRAVERKRRMLSAELASVEDQEVRVFRSRAAVLRDLGYLDGEWRLTPLGRIAAGIRHPRMLILAEAIRARILPADAAALAALSAALGTERIGPPRRGPAGDGRGRHHWRRGGGHWHGAARGYQAARWQDAAEWRGPADSLLASALNQASAQIVRKALAMLRGIVGRINKRLSAAGLPEDAVEREFDAVAGGAAPAFQRAAVVGAWAAGRSWEEVVARHRVPEGDLQRLIWQAAEILAQLEDLPPGPLPEAARAAREALLRTPVL